MRSVPLHSSLRGERVSPLYFLAGYGEALLDLLLLRTGLCLAVEPRSADADELLGVGMTGTGRCRANAEEQPGGGWDFCLKTVRVSSTWTGSCPCHLQFFFYMSHGEQKGEREWKRCQDIPLSSVLLLGTSFILISELGFPRL